MPHQFVWVGVPAVALLLALLVPDSVQAETRFVQKGQSLQAALNAAAPGDILLLEPGAEFVGNFTLPAKPGEGPIIVRSAPSDLLPTAGQRIGPEQASLLARIRSPNAASAMKTAPGARGWQLQYLEFAGNHNGYGDILQIGDGSKSQNAVHLVPQQIVLSHLYVHGDPRVGQKRCIALNAAHVRIVDSYVAECKAVGQDAQAIAGWNGPGPYVIENNYLEGAGENVLFGGSDPAIAGLVADGVTFRRNHVARPMSWREPILATPQGASATALAGGSLAPGVYGYRIVARGAVGQGTTGRSTASVEVRATAGGDGAVRIDWTPVSGATEYRVYGRTPGAQTTFWTVTTTSFVDTGGGGAAGAVPNGTGTVWTVKNLFELKNARNVIVQGNIFENHWKEAQPGYAIVLTPRNSGGTCTWCVVERVRFEYNVVRHVSAGFNVLGRDVAATPSLQTNDIVIRHNLFYDMGAAYGGNGWFLQIGDAPRDLVIDHNTVSHTGTSLIFLYGGSASLPSQVHGVEITNNAARHGSYGINGQHFSYGHGIISGYLPGASVAGNYLAGGSASRYPSGNRFGGAFEDEFVQPQAGDFRLRAGSQLQGAATDGTDVGADLGQLLQRVDRVAAGTSVGPRPRTVEAPRNLRIVLQ